MATSEHQAMAGSNRTERLSLHEHRDSDQGGHRSPKTTRSRGSRYSSMPQLPSEDASLERVSHNGDLELTSLRCNVACNGVDGQEADGGWKWTIVAASYVGHFLVGLTFAMFSVLYLEFTWHFQMEKGVTGWIGSLHSSCLHFSGIISSVIVLRQGCRPVCIAGSVIAAVGYLASSFAESISVLYLTFGVISGCGNGMVLLSSTVVVQQHFNRRRAMAAGIAAAGISVGTVASGPFVRWLLDLYQWRGTLLLISAIYLNGIAAGFLYQPPAPRKPTPSKFNESCGDRVSESSSSKAVLWKQIFAQMFDFSLFSNTPFVFFCLTTFCMTIGIMPMYQHMTSRAVFDGVDVHLAALLPSALGVSTMTSRVLFSFISNLSCMNRFLQYGLGVTLGGVVEVLSVLSNKFATYLGFCLIYGLFNGCYLTVQPTVLVDLLGVENIARSQALLSLFLGFGNLISVPFAGFLFDLTLDYNIPFYVLGGLQVVGGLLILPAFCIKTHTVKHIEV